MSQQSTPLAVSVIVPAYRAGDEAKQWLTCMQNQTFAKDHFEVILVDNGDNADLQALRGHFDRLQIVPQPKPGSYAARNAGVQASRGRALAFTDIDCLPDADWLSQGMAALGQACQPVVLGGRVEMFRADADSDRLFAAHDLVYALDQARSLADQGFLATANLMMLRRTFDRVGPFDEDVYSGGDVRWCRRARAAGVTLQYCDAVVVRHPARSTLRALVNKARRTVSADLVEAGANGRVDRQAAVRKAMRLVARPPLGWRQLQRARAADLPAGERCAALVALLVARYAKVFECVRLGLGGQPRRQ